MEAVTEIEYPSQEILEENHEYVILWMLHNNEVCTWADFLQKPVEIKQATLSNNLQQLLSNLYVKKIRRGHYQITDAGRKYFDDLDRVRQGDVKNFPPKTVLLERNYSDIILWMLFHNDYCTWSDFLEDPLNINQSSLSKYLNLLLNQDYIQKNNKKYLITEKGKNEYYTLIQKYHLDRQSILNEKLKHIDQETAQVETFLDELGIMEPKLKYYFCNLRILLDYKKIAPVLQDEQIFNKILLYLTLNHPDQYPQYISPQDFSEMFNIEVRVLEYYLYEIIHNNLFSTFFFEISTESGQHFYFHEGEKLEKILAAIVEDIITQETFFSQVPNFSLNKKPSRIAKIVQLVLNEIKRKIFDEELEDALKLFLTKYINFRIMKLEEVPFSPNAFETLDSIALYHLPKNEGTMNSNDGNTKAFHQPKYREIAHEITRLLEIGDTEAAKPLVQKLYQEKENLDLFSLRFLGFWLILTQNYAESLKIFELLEKEQADNEEQLLVLRNNKAYCYLYMGNLEKALEMTSVLMEKQPDQPNYIDSHGEVLAAIGRYEEAIRYYTKALNSPKWQILKHHTYVKLAEVQLKLEQQEAAKESANRAIASMAISRRSYRNRNYRKAKEILHKIENTFNLEN